MTREETQKTKVLTLRLTENLWSILKFNAQKKQISTNRLIHLILTNSFEKKNVLFDEIVSKSRKRDMESRVHFTIGEVDILKAYASSNGWSLSQEIWYRVISSFAKKPKLSGEELMAIYAVRSSINVLGANLNRLIRDSQPLCDTNIQVCQELIILMKEIKEKISYLEKCNSSYFKIKA